MSYVKLRAKTTNVPSVIIKEVINFFLVDNDMNGHFMFFDALSNIQQPINIVTAENGKIAMESLHEANNFVPDIIFLDLFLPELNGIECLKEIRSARNLKNIPCIIFTTDTSLLSIEQTYRAGANLYIIKPYINEQLTNIIEKILQINWEEYFPPRRELYVISEEFL